MTAIEDAIEVIARRFHETYEALAPMFGYETRKRSAVPWAQVPDDNKDLMRAVVGALLDVGGVMVAADDVEGLRAALLRLGALEQVGWRLEKADMPDRYGEPNNGIYAQWASGTKQPILWPECEWEPVYRFKGEQT